MAGHSKWANIQHRKGKQDAKRGKIFTRLIKEITVAARMGGGDPGANPRLRLAMDKAYANNMPKDNVERAIKRGSGELEGVEYLEIRYEGYGINGAAVMVDCMTDNKTRTVADVRHAFSKYGGNLGTDGSVAFMFKHCGQMIFAPGTDENALMEVALDAGAEDIVTNDDGSIEVITAPNDFMNVKQALEAAGYKPEFGEVIMKPASEAARRAGRFGRRAGSLYDGGDRGLTAVKGEGGREKGKNRSSLAILAQSHGIGCRSINSQTRACR
jgi:YebC/PmpR family DNA-binding regulatory protein